MSGYEDKKDGTVFPTRTGPAKGSATERQMLDSVDGSGGIRTKIRTDADGSVTTLRTRNGFPEFETKKKVEEEKGDEVVHIIGETAKHHLFDSSSPYKITLNFREGKAKVAAIPLSEYDGSDGSDKWKLYRRNRKWTGENKDVFLYHLGPAIDMTRHGLTISHGSIKTLYTGEPLNSLLESKSLRGALGIFDVDINGVTYKAIANEVDVYNFNTGQPLSNYGYNVQRPSWSPVNHIFWNGVPTIFRLRDGKTTVAINVRPTYDNGATHLPGGSYTFDDVSGVLTKIAEDATYSMVGQITGIAPNEATHVFDPVYGGRPWGYEKDESSGGTTISSSAEAVARAVVSGHFDSNSNFVPLIFDVVCRGAHTDSDHGSAVSEYVPTEFDDAGNGKCGTYSYSKSSSVNFLTSTEGEFTISVGSFLVTEVFSDARGHSSSASQSGSFTTCPVGSPFPGVPELPPTVTSYWASAGGRTFASHLSVPEEQVHLVLFLRAEHPTHSYSDSDGSANGFITTWPDTSYTPVFHLFDCKKGRHRRFELAPKSLPYELAGRGFADFGCVIPVTQNETHTGAEICDADGCRKYASGVLPESIGANIDAPGALHDVISYNPEEGYPLYSLYGAVYADEKLVVFSVRNPKDPTIVLNMAIDRKSGKELEFNTADGKSFQLIYAAPPRITD